MVKVGQVVVGAATTMVAGLLWGMQKVADASPGVAIAIAVWGALAVTVYKIVEATLVHTEQLRFVKWDQLRGELSKAQTGV
jgi:hypothetical protein